MKTKAISILLAVSLLITLAACSSNNDSSVKTYTEAEYKALLSENARLQAELDALRQGNGVAELPDSYPEGYWPDTPVSDFDYIYNAELGGVEITRYKGTNSLRVRVPDEIEGQPVVSIGGSIIGNRFSVPFFKSNVKEVYLPNTIVRIGSEAFMESGITNIIIPDSVIEIGSGAFERCAGLESIKIGNGVSQIGVGAVGSGMFSDTPLYDNAPDGLFYVDNWLIGYKGEKPAGLVSIREGTVGIAECALAECGGLTSVTMPSSVKFICANAFLGSNNLDETSRARILEIDSNYDFD